MLCDIGVWVVGVLPRGGGVFLCKVSVKRGEDVLWVRGYIVCCGVSNCLEVGLFSSSGEESGIDL